MSIRQKVWNWNGTEEEWRASYPCDQYAEGPHCSMMRAVAVQGWFGHDPARWEEFRQKYLDELEGLEEPVGVLREAEERVGTVTLLYAAKDLHHNHARVIAEFLGAG